MSLELLRSVVRFQNGQFLFLGPLDQRYQSSRVSGIPLWPLAPFTSND